MSLFDRKRMVFQSLTERYSKLSITEVSIDPECSGISKIDPDFIREVEPIADQIIHAKQNNAAVICAFGAHSIKNGLGRLLGTFMSDGWFTHLCTNGAGIIHDWEFSYLGKSSEDVRANVAVGRFGTWNETGLYINLAITAGAYEGLGYGTAIGKMIMDDGLHIPAYEELLTAAEDSSLPPWKRAAALDYLDVLKRCSFKDSFFLSIPHPYKQYSIHFLTSNSGSRFTCHPMFGHDIIYTHFANCGAAIGRTAERDFLSYANSVSHLENGVYLSIGSAVMSPMIFEKCLSMARNVSLQEGSNIEHFNIHVIDLQQATWDWNTGEPPMDNPAYYLRFMKTFNRMGGRVNYIGCDNRDFLLALYSLLCEKSS